MSGHSKWAKIKRQKGANDMKKGAIFTKLGRNISLAAKEGGGDPNMNFNLRIAIDKAKAVNMPSDNIERSIKKGIGGEEKGNYQKITYESMFLGTINLLIDCQTDNTNRTVAEIKKILDNAGAKLASIGSVSWQFEEKGLIVVKPAKLKKSEKFGKDDTYEDVDIDELVETLFEIDGVEDFSTTDYESDDGALFKVVEVVTDKNAFFNVLKEIERQEYKIISFELAKIANDQISLTEEELEKYDKLVENLEDHDDVDSVWSNVK